VAKWTKIFPMTSKTTSANESLKLLLVEDNLFTSMMVEKTLESLGVERVMKASNGHEALEFLDRPDAAPDVILMDLRMPGMGGLELISRLKDRQYSGFVIVTSGVDEETMKSVQEIATRSNINVLGFLPKPLTATALKELLGKASG
jgi:CheY-like chemotaxis protein